VIAPPGTSPRDYPFYRKSPAGDPRGV